MSRLCAWCPRAPESQGARGRRSASHGICRACLAAELRAERSSYTRAGARFYVWDDDVRAGAGWAAELAAADAGNAERVRRVNG